MIRLFAALPVPAEIAIGLADIRAGVPGARWRPDETLHITLRFFDEVKETLAADLDEALTALDAEAFDLWLSGAGVFGPGDHMNAIWAGVGESARLRQLAARCEAAARRCSLAEERRKFRPHVTLAYLKHSPQARVAEWVQTHSLLASPTWRATHFGLYSSWRSAQGSRYELERTYPLM
jgi:2'-5' RNA ligase